MTKRFTYSEKQNGSTLEAAEWNALAQDVSDAVDAINAGDAGGSTVVIEGDSHVKFDATGKHNLTIETTALDQYMDGTKTKGGKINIEPISDLQIKPGDDVILCSHHREDPTEVSVKIHDGEDHPVKLQVNTADIVLTTKDKSLTKEKDSNGNETSTALYNDPEVLNVAVNCAKNTRGYLKVRAQAIDLRCEKHGGIALQPKGYDNDGNMNKIKFEHGGGDGLEFGTFNTEKSSLYTDEYRFKKDGVWKMATRTTEASNKAIIDEKEGGLGNLPATAALKYVKQADDFYDIISAEDPETTTEAIIKTAGALNNEYVETSLSSKKNLKIDTISHYRIVSTVESDKILEPSGESFAEGDIIVELGDNWYFTSHTKDELKLIVGDQNNKLSDYIANNKFFGIGASNYFIEPDIAPKISISSEEEVDLDSKYGDVVITSGDTIKNEAPEIRLNAIKEDKSGGTVNFGATQDVIFLNKKLTKSLNVEAAGQPVKIKQMLQNNYQETVYWDNTLQKFRIAVKKLYLDDSQTTLLTPDNYSNGAAVYFEDGTRVPADYTCFMAHTSGVVTSIYKIGTKGSEDVLKKNLGEPVATFTGTTEDSLGTENTNTIPNIQFEMPTYDGTGATAVAPEEFVSVSEVNLSDIMTLVAWFKNVDNVSDMGTVNPFSVEPQL